MREADATVTPNPSASVVVLSWNGLQHLETCLGSLCRQTYTDREIVLLDNGSTDGTADYVTRVFPQVRVVRLPGNVGPCGGLNAGIREARGAFVGLINNDTEADPAWLSESVNALLANPEAGFTATRMRLFYQRALLDTAGDVLFRTGCSAKRGWLLPDGAEYDQDAWVFSSCAGAAVYRRSMLDDVGLFDEDFFGTLEDLDLSFRGQLMAYRCRYVASAIVYHKVGATVGSATRSSQLRYRIHRNRWYVLIKNLPGPLWLRYIGDLLLAETVMLAAAGRQEAGLVLRARAEVLRRLPRLLAKRRAIQRRRRVPISYLNSVLSKHWLAYRIAERSREARLDPARPAADDPAV